MQYEVSDLVQETIQVYIIHVPAKGSPLVGFLSGGDENMPLGMAPSMTFRAAAVRWSCDDEALERREAGE